MYEGVPRGTITTTTNMEIKPQSENNFCRPSELPIYTPNNYSDESTKSQVQKSDDKLENIVKEVRVTFTKYINEFVAYKRVGVDHFNHSMENLDCMFVRLLYFT